jgi:hypothetical protein
MRLQTSIKVAGNYWAKSKSEKLFNRDEGDQGDKTFKIRGLALYFESTKRLIMPLSLASPSSL